MMLFSMVRFDLRPFAFFLKSSLCRFLRQICRRRIRLEG